MGTTPGVAIAVFLRDCSCAGRFAAAQGFGPQPCLLSGEPAREDTLLATYSDPTAWMPQTLQCKPANSPRSANEASAHAEAPARTAASTVLTTLTRGRNGSRSNLDFRRARNCGEGRTRRRCRKSSFMAASLIGVPARSQRSEE